MTLTGCDDSGGRLPPASPPSEENSSYIPFQLPLELIKNELALSLVQFSDFMKATSLHEILQYSLSFEGKQLKGSTVRDGAYLSKFASQVEYIRSFLLVIKLFPTEIVAQLGWKLLRDCGKLLKAAFSEVANSNEDRNLLAQLVQFLILPLVQVTHDCIDLNSVVILEKQLLTSETVIDGYGVNRTRDIVVDAGKYAWRIFGESAEFLISAAAVSLEKPDYLRVLAMCRKVWKFNDEISKLLPFSGPPSIQEEFQSVENAMGESMTMLLPTENGRTFVQFWCEIISTTGNQRNKIPLCVQNITVSEFPELYTVFTTYLQDSWFWQTDVGKRMTPVLIRGIRQDLSSSKAETKKRAAFFLKAITSLYSMNQPLFDPKVSEVSSITLGNMERKKYTKFWMYFFELYDILDETQLHIIQPILQKLNVFQEHSSNEAVFTWLPILLSKLIGHDNRTVVKEGLERFLLTGQYFQSQRTNAYKVLAEQFLDASVMPLLKDNAGWVLNEPEEFFKNAKLYGQFLMQLYSHNDLPHFRAAEKILTFLTSSGKCMGPHTVFFCVTTLDELLQIKNSSDKEIPEYTIIIKEVESFMNLLTILMSNSLTAISKYIRDQLESHCVNILLNVIPMVKYFGELRLDSKFFLQILTFLGSISSKVMTRPDTKEKVQNIIEIFNLKGGALRDKLIEGSNLHMFAKANLRSTTVLGVLRYLTVSSQINEESFQEIEVAVATFSECMANEEMIKDSIQGVQEFYNNGHHHQNKTNKLNMNTACERLANQVYDVLGKADQISSQEFLFCVNRIELFSVLPDVFNHAPLLTLRVNQEEDHLKKFLTRKLLSIIMAPIDVPESLFCLEGLGEERLEHVECLEEVSKRYFNRLDTKIFAESYQRLFEVCTRILEKQSDLAGPLQLKLLGIILDNLEKCDPNGVASGMQLAKSVMGFASYNVEENSEIASLFDQIASVSWSLVFELRKNEAFWKVINGFVNLIVCPYFLKSGALTEYGNKIFEHGETIWGISLVFVQQLVKEDFPNELTEEAHKILVKAALSGPPLLKNNRTTFAMWDYLRKDEAQGSTDDPENFSSDCKSRLLASERLRKDISSLLSSEETKKKAETLLYSTVTYLLQKMTKSLYIDSVTLEDLPLIGSSKEYFNSSYLIVQKFPQLHAIFFFCLEDGIQTRIGFGAFFSTICLQVSKLLESSEFYDRALQSLTTLILNQRIYAQIAFQSILKKATELKYESVVQKYSTVLAALKCALINVSGNCSKLHDNVSQGFYVQDFNAATHYCHEVIYTFLLRVSCMVKDECILNPETIQDIIIEPLPTPINELGVQKVMSLQKTYLEYEKAAWHLKTVVADGRELGEDTTTATTTTTKENVEDDMNYQKKITPWKLLSVTGELEEYNNVSAKKRCVEEEGLVVVASYSRYSSCQVSVRDLETFLLSYSAKGYAILGIEQANESSSLTDFRFPKKSVLLLGNEKLGIPSELLHLVDKCIEIPQVGIIRSLNVHVTGALCIWQYASQHIL